jgi:hypothetical protein
VGKIVGKSKDVNDDIDVVFMRVYGLPEDLNRVPGSIPGPATSLLVKRRDVVAQIKADGVEVNQNAILQYGSTRLSVCQQA